MRPNVTGIGGLGATPKVGDEGGEAADEDRSSEDAEEINQPGDTDAEGGPLDPPMPRRGHEINDEQESQHERTNEKELKGAPNSQRFCVHSGDSVSDLRVALLQRTGTVIS